MPTRDEFHRALLNAEQRAYNGMHDFPPPPPPPPPVLSPQSSAWVPTDQEEAWGDEAEQEDGEEEVQEDLDHAEQEEGEEEQAEEQEYDESTVSQAEVDEYGFEEALLKKINRKIQQGQSNALLQGVAAIRLHKAKQAETRKRTGFKFH